nr:hypothetical protein [Micromonospora sp. DSM 115978]
MIRRRMARVAVATGLAVAIAVTGPARPALAVDPATATQVITAVTKAYEAWKSSKSGEELAAATAKILNAISEAKTAIIAHADELAAAEARACTTQAVIEAADVHLFPPDVLTLWAQDVTRCVTLIDSLLTVVVDKPTLNKLGFALNAVGPLALAARARAGLSTAGVAALLITSNTTVQTRSAPDCWYTSRRMSYMGGWSWVDNWGCTASDGTTQRNVTFRAPAAPRPDRDLEPIRATVGVATSWKLAQDVLPLLQA